LVFQVAPKATKTEIKEAVQSIFKVKVQSVRTAKLSGKRATPGQVHRLPSRLEKGVRTLKERREDAGVRAEFVVQSVVARRWSLATAPASNGKSERRTTNDERLKAVS